MCDFISWIEKDGQIYFLTDRDLATKEGKELTEYCGSREDLKGHGAIRKYYGLEGGENKECEDLSDPSKFPKEIQDAVKVGIMCEFDPDRLVKGVLTDKASNKYCAIRDKVLRRCNAIENKAMKKYCAIDRKEWKEYMSVRDKERKEYEAIKDKARKEYYAIRDKARKEYYDVVCPALRNLIVDKNNRVEAWK